MSKLKKVWHRSTVWRPCVKCGECIKVFNEEIYDVQLVDLTKYGFTDNGRGALKHHQETDCPGRWVADCPKELFLDPNGNLKE
mgnify:CR=1 FL=1